MACQLITSDAALHAIQLGAVVVRVCPEEVPTIERGAAAKAAHLRLKTAICRLRVVVTQSTAELQQPNFVPAFSRGRRTFARIEMDRNRRHNATLGSKQSLLNQQLFVLEEHTLRS